MPHYTNKVKVLSPLLAIAYSDNKGLDSTIRQRPRRIFS